MYNYENTKIIVDKIESANFSILILLILFSLLTLRKKKVDFFDRIETDQLKGVAIIFVIFGHLWVHVCKNNPSIILSGDAVALFLILSGFGLMRSICGKVIKQKDFIYKRLNRVMVPYWYSTVLIIEGLPVNL